MLSEIASVDFVRSCFPRSDTANASPDAPVASATHSLIVDCTDAARKALLSRSSGRIIRVATACSGSDVVIAGLRHIEEHMQQIFIMKAEETVRFQHVWSCECEPFKQEFLVACHDAAVVFPDVCKLGCSRAYNVVKRAEVTIPPFDFLIDGFLCKDLSSLKKLDPAKRAQILTQGGGTSGNTFHGICSCISVHRPRAVMMENVAGVLKFARNVDVSKASTARPNTEPDAGEEGWLEDDDDLGDQHRDILAEMFAQLGYVLHCCPQNALFSGFPQSRHRIYMLGIRLDTMASSAEGILAKLGTAYASMRDPPRAALSEFLLPESEVTARQQEARKQARHSGSDLSGAWVIDHAQGPTCPR